MIIHSPIISGSLTFADGSTLSLPPGSIYSGSFSGSYQGDAFSGGVFTGDGSGLTFNGTGIVSSSAQLAADFLDTLGDGVVSSSAQVVSSLLNQDIDFGTGGISGSTLDITGNAKIDGNLVLGGNLTIGDTSSDTITFAGDISSDIIPSTNNTYDLGSSTDKFAEIHGTTIFGSISATNGVVSGSSQITDGSGIVSSSAQIDGLGFLQVNGDSVVSGSSQVVLESADKTGFTGASSITTLGTIGTGVWQGSIIDSQYLDADPLPAGTISGSSQVDHDSTTGFVSNEHIDHSSVTLTAGDGLSGGGDITTSRTFAVDATVLRTTGDGVVSGSSQISLTGLSDYDANDHIDHTSVSITAGNGLTGGGTIAATRTLNVGAGDGISVAADTVSVDATVLRTTGDGVVSSSAQIDHDQTTNFVAGEHFLQSAITEVGTVTAGSVTAILPPGTVSGSEQIDFATIQPIGVISSSEQVEDIVGGMVSDNTETGIAVTYQDGDGTIDYVVQYGSSANTAVQGNTTLSFAGTSNEISIDGGSSITLGSGGTVTIGLADTITGNRTFSNNVTITGDLTVNGTTTTVNSNTVNIGDNILVLNSDEAGTPSQNGGIEIERGSSTNSALLWDEGNDYWVAGLAGAEERIVIGAGNTDITTLGTITTGTWNGTSISTTYTDAKVTSIVAGTGISISGATGDVTITNSDRGSSQNIFKNFAVSGQTTVVADSNNDTLTLAAGSNVTISTNASTDTITIASTDTNTTYSAGTGITLTGTTFSTNDSQIVHDSLSGFVANEHIDHTSVSISAGTGLTGGGTIAANRTLSLSHLGLESLTDPNADRVAFWDDSAGAFAWLTMGSNLSISGTTLNATDTNTTYSVSDTSGQTGIDLTLSGTTISGVTSGLTTSSTVQFAKVGVGTAADATYELKVSGDIGATGDIVAYISSDERLKDNIELISNPIEKVQSLRGVTWDWNDNASEAAKQSPNVGVIAQEVEKVLPQLVHDRENGYKGVDYAKLTGLLIEAIKDQQKQIDDLKSKLG